jgi:hypothetical protein
MFIHHKNKKEKKQGLSGLNRYSFNHKIINTLHDFDW